MTVDHDTFITRFPEFEEQSTDVIESILEEAARTTPETPWGSLRDDGILYYAAHLAATRSMQIGHQINMQQAAPLGVGLQSSMYGQTYVELRKSLPICGFIPI